MTDSKTTKLPLTPGQRVHIEAEFVQEIDYRNADGPGYVPGVMLMVAGKTVCVRADALYAVQSEREDQRERVIRVIVTALGYNFLNDWPTVEPEVKAKWERLAGEIVALFPIFQSESPQDDKRRKEIRRESAMKRIGYA